MNARDAKFLAHEATHLATVGPHANVAPTFEFQTGPDGRQYTTGSEVSIDSSPVPGDPEATVRKAQTIKRVALGPREPSGLDRQVAITKQPAKKVLKKVRPQIQALIKQIQEKRIPVTRTKNQQMAKIAPSEESPFAKWVKNQHSPFQLLFFGKPAKQHFLI